MADKDENANEVVECKIKNGTDSPVFVNTTTGTQVVPAGKISGVLEMRVCEARALPEDVTAHDPDEEDFEEEDVSAVDADLADPNSRDGLAKKDALVAIAEAEGVEIKADDSKAEIADKIMAARAG